MSKLDSKKVLNAIINKGLNSNSDADLADEVVRLLKLKRVPKDTINDLFKELKSRDSDRHANVISLVYSKINNTEKEKLEKILN